MIMAFLSFPAIAGVDRAVVPDGIVTLADAALRSALAAAVVWAGLGLFRARNVLVQKAAWGLVLAGALMMTLFAPWAARVEWIPAEATLVVPGQTWLRPLMSKLATPDPLDRAASPESSASAAAFAVIPVSTAPIAT